MKQWLPYIFVVILALLLLAAPWRRVDPKHELIIDLLSNLADNGSDRVASAQGRADTLGHWAGSGRDHDTGGVDV